MGSHNKQIGAWGEGVAAEYLARNGRKLEARNIRTPYGEIDIVALDGDVTIFVEVKTLTKSDNFFPEHQITPRKREHMLASARHYAMENDIDHWQIDVIAVIGKPGSEPQIEHFENALG